MGKKDNLTKVKDTDNYVHYDFPGIKESDFKSDEFKTVNIEGGHKMIIGRHKKTDELTAVRLLMKKDKK